jgi:dipeptidyl aminopeptidase/acylaminoacyl peptidase
VRRALATASLAALSALAVAAGTATATPPGINGLIAFEETNSGQLFTMTAAGTNQSPRLTDTPEENSDAAWSPDGTKIAFTSRRDGGDPEIYIMNADGSNPRRFTVRSGDDEQPTWSPDGTRIAWVSDQFGNTDIVSANLDGSGFRQHTSNGAFADTNPEYSPDGSLIAFRSNRSGSGDIYVVDANGGPEAGIRQITNDATADATPTWSPDGSRIAFTSSRSGNEDIWSVGSGGLEQSPRQLTNDPGGDREPSWSPDGARIAFVSTRGGGTAHIWTTGSGGTEAGPLQLTSSVILDEGPAWQTVAPLPAVASLSPAGVVSGSPDVAIIVQGSGFVRRSQVRWNGQPRATQFVSPERLTFIAPASDLAAPGAARVTVATSPVGGGESAALQFAVNPGIVLTKALLQPRWHASTLVGKLDLRGVVGRPALLEAQVFKATGGKAVVTRRFQVNQAGSFAEKLKLDPHLLPGRYTVRVNEASGAATPLPSAQRAAKLSAPREGVVSRAFFSTKIGGRPMARITGRSIIFAHYRFAARPKPGRKLTVRWFSPGARRPVAIDRKPITGLVIAFIKGSGALPKGPWRAELRYGNTLVATARTRVG